MSMMIDDDMVVLPPYPILTPLRPRASRTRSDTNLVFELAITAFRLKYAGSLLGYVWSLVKPLLLFGMMYAFFAGFLHVGAAAPDENFAVELLLGIVVWSFFSEATNSGLFAVVGNSDMVRKAYFPRWILVVSATLSSAMTLALNLGLVAVIGGLLHWFSFSLASLLFIPLLFELYLLAIGLALLLSSAFVYFRDLSHVWEVVLQGLFFASAILIPLAAVPPKYRFIVELNPVAQIIGDMRRSIVSPNVPYWSTNLLGGWTFVPPMITVLLVVGGAAVFLRLSRRVGQHL